MTLPATEVAASHCEAGDRWQGSPARPTLAEVLQRREDRRRRQQELIAERHMPVVCFTCVCPGEIKNSNLIQTIFAHGVLEIMARIETEEWPCWVKEEYDASTGPELLLAVDADPGDLKRAMSDVETTHSWGRLWDIDVIDEDHGIISRTMIGLLPRQCLICDQPSPVCARNRTHSVDELLAVISSTVGLAGHHGVDVAALAVQALLIEARLTPKPGLVDADNNGAHHDMDLALFETSAQALRGYFSNCVAAATKELPLLQAAGLRAEETMLAATGGINTHKGAIFSLGLAVAGRVRYPTDLVGLCNWVAVQASTLVQAWKNDHGQPVTHGEQAYHTHGILGARGEALQGFATVRCYGLPAYLRRFARYGDEADALRFALVAIMAHNADTNVLARGGLTALHDVQQWAHTVINQDLDPNALRMAMTVADTDFIRRGISPGGSADLLAVCWFLVHSQPELLLCGDSIGVDAAEMDSHWP